MFFENSLGELTKYIAKGIPKLSTEPSKTTLVLIQSRWVNIKIIGRREPGLMIMLFISSNEKITNVTWEQLNMERRTLLRKLFQRITYLKGGFLRR